MTQNNTFSEYYKEVAPKQRDLNKKEEILRDWKTTDGECLEFQAEVAEVNARYKKYVDEKEAELIGEIKDLKTDISQAIKGMVRGTKFKAAEVKAFVKARSKEEGVEKVTKKGKLFEELNKELA